MADTDEDLAAAYRLKLHLTHVTEMFLGFTGLNTYECEEPAFRDKFDAVGVALSAVAEKEVEDFAEQPVNYAAFKNSVHLTSRSVIPAGANILTCYGVVVEDVGQEIKPRMIKTSQNFIIDGRKQSSLWIFIHESCNGNCELKEGWRQTPSGPQFTCWLAAKADINPGDKLTINFGGFSGQNDTVEICKCGYGACPSLLPPPSPPPGENEYPCKDPICKEHKTVYKTKVGLALHEKLVHGKEPSKDVKLREKGKGTIKCTFKVGDKECGKPFYEKKYLTRHVKQVHEKSQTRKCEKCGHTYLTEANYKAHFANKKGCTRKRKRDVDLEEDEGEQESGADDKEQEENEEGDEVEDGDEHEDDNN